MPKVKAKKRQTDPKQATRAAQPEEAMDKPAVERVLLLDDDGVEQDDTWIVILWYIGASVTAEAREVDVSAGWHQVRSMKWDDFMSYIQFLSKLNSAPKTVLYILGKSSICQIHNLTRCVCETLIENIKVNIIITLYIHILDLAITIITKNFLKAVLGFKQF